jgi:hypothetical protein
VSSALIAASQSRAAVPTPWWMKGGEVVAGKPGFVGDDQPSGGLQRVEAFGPGTERSCE